jgi:hypothetical protein
MNQSTEQLRAEVMRLEKEMDRRADVEQAKKEGCEIQINLTGNWVTAKFDVFDWTRFDYRIHPATRMIFVNFCACCPNSAFDAFLDENVAREKQCDKHMRTRQFIELTDAVHACLKTHNPELLAE